MFLVRKPKWNTSCKTYELGDCNNAEKGFSTVTYRPICVYANHKNLYNFFICFSRLRFDANHKIVLGKSRM